MVAACNASDDLSVRLPPSLNHPLPLLIAVIFSLTPNRTALSNGKKQLQAQLFQAEVIIQLASNLKFWGETHVP